LSRSEHLAIPLISYRPPEDTIASPPRDLGVAGWDGLLRRRGRYPGKQWGLAGNAAAAPLPNDRILACFRPWRRRSKTHPPALLRCSGAPARILRGYPLRLQNRNPVRANRFSVFTKFRTRSASFKPLGFKKNKVPVNFPQRH
jgi:hypothetical protein